MVLQNDKLLEGKEGKNLHLEHIEDESIKLCAWGSLCN